MANLGMEMTQAETAFTWPEGDRWRLRWFTPELEVDLCGHATLATAKVLWETNRHSGPIQFETLSGTLTCSQVEDRVQMDFPAEFVKAEELPLPIEDFGKVVWTGRNRMDWFIEVEDEEILRQAKPDLALLSQLPCRGLIVTAKGSQTDFISRFFAPQAGVPEDPVTGSAHCALGPYWANRLEKTDLIGYQASRRGGFVHVIVQGDRILLGGNARIVVIGEWRG
jgi:PhzF family phenazine biosynthesis protein